MLLLLLLWHPHLRGLHVRHHIRVRLHAWADSGVLIHGNSGVIHENALLFTFLTVTVAKLAIQTDNFLN